MKGLWITLSPGASGNSRTRVKMPISEGMPLLADWNGDGVATPGVFTAGQWLITNAAVGRSSWEGFASLGSTGDIPLTGNRDDDGKADIATFRDGIWNWRDSTGKQEPTNSANAEISRSWGIGTAMESTNPGWFADPRG